MNIKFTCPRCKKVLRVTAELAGKKAKCPGCQQALTIPKPPAAATAKVPDIDALAAAAFGDGPAAAAAAPVKTPSAIDFPCPYCDEPVRVSADLAGKQAPCPQCGRVVKVPVPTQTGPRDWRNVETRLPSAARRDSGPAPEGAWGTATSTSTVSVDSLEEAGALPVIQERVPARVWVGRIIVGSLALTLIVAGVLGMMHHRWLTRQKNALELAQHYLTAPEGTGNPALSPEEKAELYRAIGEYHIHANRPEDARKSFQSGRSQLSGKTAAPSPEREALLIDIALSQVDLGGAGEELAGRERLKWEVTATELRQTMQQLQLPEARAEAVQQVSRKLIARGQPALAVTLAHILSPGEEAAERHALVGLELYRAGKREEAERIAAQSVHPYEAQVTAPKGAAAPQLQLPISPSLVALLVALGDENKAHGCMVPFPKDDVPPLEARLGYAQGRAHQGKIEEALAIAGKDGSPVHRVQALVAVANVAAGKQPPVDAKVPLEKAVALVLDGQSGDSKYPSWLLLRLVRLAARAGLPEGRLQEVIGRIPEKDFQGRASLELLRAQLAADPRKLPDLSKPETRKQYESYPPSIETIVRQSGSASPLKSADIWEPKSLRPFAYIGVALGVQDNGR